LRLISALQSEYTIEIAADISQLLQRLRKQQYHGILLCCRTQKEAIQYCHKMITDIRKVPKLGIVDPNCILQEPHIFVQQNQVDGYLGGYISTEEIQHFVKKMLEVSTGKKTVIVGKHQLSLLEKVIQRIRS